jgi:hypothetical protein
MKIKWCDLSCPQAKFPSRDKVDGACRTFVALYCERLQRLVMKNAPCQARPVKRKKSKLA